MAKLCKLAKLIRSKNAGPFQLTFDILFDDPIIYKKVKMSGVISKERFSKLYKVPKRSIILTEYEQGLAIKITIPRSSAGDPMDTDVMGSQQFGPLVDLEVPSVDLPEKCRKR